MAKAIASLASLKATWDIYRMDTVDLFVLLVVTMFGRRGYGSADVHTLCEDFKASYGMSMPYHPMVSVLKRATKKGYLQKSEGRYSSRGVAAPQEISAIIAEQETKYQLVIREFLEFCEINYGRRLSDEEADAAFIAFLHNYDLDILFAAQRGETVLPDVSAVAEQRFLMYSFVRDVIRTGSPVFAFIVDISVGHIIANTILVRDYSQMQGKLSDCHFYLDTGFLFGVTGADGQPMKEAYTEWVKLIHSQGASLLVFRHTYEEFLGNLEACLRWIEAPGFDIRRASRACLTFREMGYEASDVEEFITHVDSQLSALGIDVVDTPAPMTGVPYQIDEKRLQDLIVEMYRRTDPLFDEEGRDLALYRDVKSITAVYKLRGGRKPRSLPQAHHIFVTTNATLALASRLFEAEESGTDFYFIPAALTDVFVGTLVWIRSPSGAEINERRLIAIAYAALQPSKAWYERCVDSAEGLQKRGVITQEDVALLQESRTVRNELYEATFGDPGRVSDGVLTDVLDKVRSQIRQEEVARFDKERETLRAEKAEAQQLHAQEMKRQQDFASLQAKELLRIKTHLDARAEATITGWLRVGVFLGIVLGLVIVVLVLVVGWNKVEPWLAVLGGVPLVASWVYFALRLKEPSPRALYEELVRRQKLTTYKRAGFDIESFEKLQSGQSVQTPQAQSS